MILWFAFYRKEKQPTKQESLAFNGSVAQSKKGKSFWQWLAIPFVACFAYFRKVWKNRQEKNKFWKEFKKNNVSLNSLLDEIKESDGKNINASIAPNDLPVEVIKKDVQDDEKGSQFVIIK